MITNSTLFWTLQWAVEHTDASDWSDPCWTVNGQREVYLTFEFGEFKIGSISEYDFLVTIESFQTETDTAIAYYMQVDYIKDKIAVGLQRQDGAIIRAFVEDQYVC